MKKILSLILALVLCFSICACGGNTEETATETTTAPLSAKEQLSANEKTLFIALLSIAEEFATPDSIRIINTYDYNERTKYKPDDIGYDYSYGPDTIIVHLKGEFTDSEDNTISNPYYMVCLNGAENTSDSAQISIQSEESSIDAYRYSLGYAIDSLKIVTYKSRIMKYKAATGDYLYLTNKYETSNEENEAIDISRVNNALKEHFENLGY